MNVECVFTIQLIKHAAETKFLEGIRFLRKGTRVATGVNTISIQQREKRKALISSHFAEKKSFCFRCMFILLNYS